MIKAAMISRMPTTTLIRGPSLADVFIMIAPTKKKCKTSSAEEGKKAGRDQRDLRVMR
jgi:hypothetical protein